MNITFKRDSREVEIEGLSEGVTFINADEIGWNDPTIFMVIDEPCQLFAKKDGFNYQKFAVNLDNGRVIGFYDNDKVILVSCDLNASIN